MRVSDAWSSIGLRNYLHELDVSDTVSVCVCVGGWVGARLCVLVHLVCAHTHSQPYRHPHPQTSSHTASEGGEGKGGREWEWGRQGGKERERDADAHTYTHLPCRARLLL